MSEWTKERIEKLRKEATAFSAYIIHSRYNNALDEIERLQSEVETLRSQQAELIEVGNHVVYSEPTDDWAREEYEWIALAKKLTGGNA